MTLLENLEIFFTMQLLIFLLLLYYLLLEFNLLQTAWILLTIGVLSSLEDLLWCAFFKFHTKMLETLHRYLSTFFVQSAMNILNEIALQLENNYLFPSSNLQMWHNIFKVLAHHIKCRHSNVFHRLWLLIIVLCGDLYVCACACTYAFAHKAIDN